MILPVTTVEALRPVVVTTPVTSASGSATILLVEDEAPLRRVTTLILQRAGYTVFAAGSGREALDIARTTASTVDLLMTDMVIPHMSGEELATTFRSPHPATATLYRSGYTEATFARADLMRERSWFMQKPFLPHGLLMMVREALGNA